MPVEHDFEFGKAAVAAGQMTQDQLDECIELLVALERVGSQKRLWDTVLRKGYMTESQVAALRRGKVDKPAPGREPDETAEDIPTPIRRAEGYALALIQQGGKMRLYPLPRRMTTIGHDPDCDIVLEDAAAPAQFARLRISESGFVIEGGLGNEIVVNERPTARRELAPNDVIAAGHAWLLFLEDYGDETAPEPTRPDPMAGRLWARLSVTDGPRAGTTFFLGQKPLLLGRHPLANMRLAQQAVSEFHCHIVATPTGVRLTDLHSENGTRVNGRAATRLALEEGDKISAGGQVIEFHSLTEAEADAAATPEGREFDIGLEAEVEPTTDMLIRQGVKADAHARQPVAKRYVPGQLKLVGAEGVAQGRSFILKGRVTVIGRDEKVSLPINDDSLSRRHAQIAFQPDKVEVRDLGSRNGVFVNGTRVMSAAVKPGDALRLGKCLFIVDEVRVKRTKS